MDITMMINKKLMNMGVNQLYNINHTSLKLQKLLLPDMNQHLYVDLAMAVMDGFSESITQ